MKFLFVVHYPIFGGPHNQALRLNSALARRDWQTTVVLPQEPGNAVEWLRGAGVEVVQIPLHRLRARPDPGVQLRFVMGLPSEVFRIRRLIRLHRIDLVVLAGLGNPHAAIAARLAGVPVVSQIVDTRLPRVPRAVFMRIALRYSDALMFDGHALVELHLGGREIHRPSFVYYPPVPTDHFYPSAERRRTMRLSLGVPEQVPTVGMVANLNPQKGIEYFIRAAGLIHRSIPECRFLIVGARYQTHAEYTKFLEAEIKSTGIPASHFILTGDRADVENYYPVMDVKLITSVPRSEGTTTTVMEAMACSVPVVATNVGAISEVVENDVTGFLVPPQDAQAIASATLRLLSDDRLRKRMGKEGRRRAVERWDVEVCAETHVKAFEAAIVHHHLEPRPNSPVQSRRWPVQAPPRLEDMAACPACRGGLEWFADKVNCQNCGRQFPIRDGIPVLLIDEAESGHDELEHLHGHGHKQRQAIYFDQHQATEFEITRPHGSPRLYEQLIWEKFRRSVSGLACLLPGATVLTVCGGSGMDAEFLARIGGRVIASDISLGAVRRTVERARRFGIQLQPLVADVERLPFRDHSVDLVYVHDGLHHLEDTWRGLAEMARVADKAVSINEPAKAAVTRLAVRLGLALEQEAAGNRVARIDQPALIEELRSHGLATVRTDRYGMYYRHQPGSVLSLLSNRIIFPVVWRGWRVVNGVAGRFGNKLAVQARRV